MSGDSQPAGGGDAHNVGEVFLPGGVVGAHLSEGAPEQLGVKRIQARVDFADQALFVGGVLLFDDADDRTFVVADDPPEPGGDLHGRGDDGDRTATGCVRSAQFDERLGGEEWDIAHRHEDSAGHLR